MERLASELIFAICDQLVEEVDVNSLLRTSKRFYSLLQERLYLQNARDSCSTALTWAIARHRNDTAQRAVDAWATLLEQQRLHHAIPACAFWGQFSFIRASADGSMDVVAMLAKTGLIDINWREPASGRTALGWASLCGQSAVVSFLVESNHVLLDAADQYGETPLSLAAQAGDVATVKLLLRSGKVKLNHADRLEWRTPLAWAALQGRLDVMSELMLLPDISLDCCDVQGWTPLMLACRHGHEGAERLLLETGSVDVNHKDRYWGRTCLIYAVLMEESDVVRVLLDSADILANATDIHGHTALSLAVQAGAGGIVSLLLDSGKADMGSLDSVYGKAPLRRGRVRLSPPAAWPPHHGQRPVPTCLRGSAAPYV